jgi:predicted small secreted protein
MGLPPMKSNIKNVALVLIGAVLFALVGTGCNTSKGFGKDVEKLGDKIQEKAK